MELDIKESIWLWGARLIGIISILISLYFALSLIVFWSYLIRYDGYFWAFIKIVISVGFLITGIYILMLRNWARIMFLSLLGFLLGYLFSLLVTRSRAHSSFIITILEGCIIIVPFIFFFYFFTRPEAKSVFK
ncbi:MAG: hypothetical protein KJ880_07070 [Candidatus Omnitrophica bacterium]|nr:hypothetical protein [Candidatus Omnitrophota bacterium]